MLSSEIARQLWSFVISDPGQRLIQNLIAITALGFAIRGVRNWKRERRDLRRAELAEKTLTLGHRAFDAIATVREPQALPGEGASRRRGEGETPEIAQALNATFTPLERLNAAGEIFEEIKALRYSIAAAFSLRDAEPLLVFLAVHTEIARAAISKMRDIAGPRPPAKDEAAAIARSERNDAVIWSGYADPDPIAARLITALETLDATFRPYIEAKFRPLNRWRLRWLV